MLIAVSAWSFHQALYDGQVRQVDVPGRAAALGFKHIELLEMFLRPRPPGRLARLLGRAAPPNGPDYRRATLAELRAARLRAGVRLACWALDTDLCLADPQARRAQLARIATALQAAHYLGAPLVRLTTGGQAGDKAGLGCAVDTLRSIAVVAASSGLKLAVENHLGLSEDPQALAALVTAIAQPRLVGVCLDLGNSPRHALEQLAPLAIHAHAKSRHLGPDGHETDIDYPAGLAALRAAGYAGVLSIEYEGDGDPVEGILKTRALIERYGGGAALS